MISLKKKKKNSKNNDASFKNSNAPTLLVANINMRLTITSLMKSRAILSTATPGKKQVLLCDTDKESQLDVPLHGIFQILISIEIDIGAGGFVTVLHNDIVLYLQPVA